jgi:hypothetical protein
MNACNEKHKKYINPYIKEATDNVKKNINKQKTSCKKCAILYSKLDGKESAINTSNASICDIY